MSGLTCQQIAFACAERKSQRGLWLGLNAFAAYDLDRPIAFDHLICDGGIQANYLDALNASRVRIHRQKPKALGLKFGCGFTRHLFHQGSPASGYRPLGGGAVTAQAQAGTRSFDPPRWRGRASVGEVIE